MNHGLMYKKTLSFIFTTAFPIQKRFSFSVQYFSLQSETSQHIYYPNLFTPTSLFYNGLNTLCKGLSNQYCCNKTQDNSNFHAFE